MADDGKVEIDVGLKQEELKKNISEIESAFSKMGADTSKSAKKTDDALQKLQKSMTAYDKSTKKASLNIIESIKKIGDTMHSLKNIYEVTTGVVGKVIGTLASMTDAANAQGDAETKLAMAAKKNPYLDDYSVKKLKDYAGELQSVSEVGDEVLLPMMAELAAEGKNQAQIMDTMSAALDMAAGTGQDLGACIDALSKTYNGVSGALAKTYPEIANLTEEELRQGKAVEILGGKYKGMSEATASPFAQLKNSVIALGEKFGALLLPAAQSIASTLTAVADVMGAIINKSSELGKKIDKMCGGAFSNFATKIQEANEKFKEWLKLTGQGDPLKLEEMTGDLTGASKVEITTSNLEKLEKQLDKLKAKKENLLEQYGINDETLKIAEKLKEIYKKLEGKTNFVLSDEEEELVLKYPTLLGDIETAMQELEPTEKEILNTQNKIMRQSQQQARAVEQAKAEEAAAAQEAANAEAQANEKAKQSLLERYEAEMRALEQDWKAREKAEGKITDEQKAQEKYNKAVQTYIALQKENAASGKRADTSALDAKAKGDIKSAMDEITRAMDNKTLEQFKSESKKMFEDIGDMSVEAVETTYKNLCALRDTLVENIADPETKKKLIDAYEELHLKLERAKNEANKKEKHDSVLNNADSLVSDDTKKVLKDDGSPFGSTLNDYDAHAEAIKAAMAEIKQAHEDGLISDTEYLEREKALDEELRQSKFETFEQIGGKLMDFATQSNQILQDACNLWLESVKAESEAEQAEIEKKYKNGELSEEEYNEKMKEAKRKAAKEEYKIKMIQWASDLLLAQSNVAMGIASSLKSGAPAGIIAAAMTGAAGAVQLATAIANKPSPPSFATGGVVGGFGGASAGGDNTYAHVRTGEMILNAGQQKSLWEKLNALDNAPQRSGGNNVSITNNASNDVSAKAQFSEDKLNIYIDKRVNAGLSDGRYGKSLTMAEQMQEGIMYGI